MFNNMIMTVLIVDDDHELRIAFKYQFESFGFIVFEAKNGLEAIEYIKENSFDLVLSDVQMPILSGMDLLKELKRLNLFNKSPVVIMTGGSDYSESDFLNEGAVAYYEKGHNFISELINTYKQDSARFLKI